MPRQRTPEEMAEYQRARRAKMKAEPMKVSTTVEEVKLDLESTLKRRRGKPRLRQTDGERLGDGLPDTSELIARMTQKQRDAILARIPMSRSTP